MARLFGKHTFFIVLRLSLPFLMGLVAPSAAFAQGSQGLSSAIFALERRVQGRTSDFNGRLYGGAVAATIENGDGDADNFSDADRMRRFSLAPVGEADAGLTFDGGNREQFENWVRENAGRILEILFPTSLSAAVLGGDLSQDHAQQFLLTQALEIAPAQGAAHRLPGGLLEFEWFQRAGATGDSGRAWRGFYEFEGKHLSIEGRYARQNQDISTRSTTIGVAYHPYVQVDPSLDWRVGLDARSSLLYSSSNALDLGTLDLGAGVWTSARKDFSRLRVGGGALVQGTKSHVPSFLVGDGYTFLADAVNERRIAYDVAYGTIVGYAVAPRTSLNVKILETRAIAPEADRPASRVVLASVSHLFGGDTPIDVGYKVVTGGGVDIRSVFLQGNFRW